MQKRMRVVLRGIGVVLFPTVRAGEQYDGRNRVPHTRLRQTIGTSLHNSMMQPSWPSSTLQIGPISRLAALPLDWDRRRRFVISGRCWSSHTSRYFSLGAIWRRNSESRQRHRPRTRHRRTMLRQSRVLKLKVAAFRSCVLQHEVAFHAAVIDAVTKTASRHQECRATANSW